MCHRSAKTIVALFLALLAGPLVAAPYIRLSPSTAVLQVGATLDVTLECSTGSGTARGGAAEIVFDPAVCEIVGGAAGVTKAAESVFGLTPGPSVNGGVLQIAFLKTDFSLVTYTGPLARFKIHIIGGTANPILSFTEASTRFAPIIAGTTLTGGDYLLSVSSNDVKDALLGLTDPPPDQNGDGVVDIADLLAKL